MKDIELFAFDLDGTLLDTAPDFFKSVNILRQKYNLDEADYVQVRSLVSQGAASLAAYALELKLDETEAIEFHRQELLEIYEECCLDATKPFDGVDTLLAKLNEKKIKWGIVTNKPRKFAEKIVRNKLDKLKSLPNGNRRYNVYISDMFLDNLFIYAYVYICAYLHQGLLFL